MLWNRAKGPMRARRALAVCGALALSACASHYALVPPRLDLAPYGRVALVTFSDDRSDGALSTFATQQFAEALLASQSRIELLELDTADAALRGLAPSGDAGALAQALGRRKNVPAVFVGDLKLSRVKPRGLLGGGDLRVKASVSAELSVRLVSTESGGTMWRSSATANSTVGQVAIGDGLPSVAMRDPNDAYGDMVRALVTDVTRDFRPTRVKQ